MYSASMAGSYSLHEAEDDLGEQICSGIRDDRKCMCNIIRCEECEYAFPFLPLTNQVRVDRTGKSSGDEVNKSEQLKNHCTSLCREEWMCDGKVRMDQRNVRT